MYEYTQDLAVHFPTWNVQSKRLLCSIGLHIGVKMYVDVKTWSRATARLGDPPQDQVQSMLHQHMT